MAQVVPGGFWIDIEDAAGTKVGDGPIASAYLWQSHPRLDAAGDFLFELPVEDPKAALLANKRTARCYGLVAGAMTDLGAGTIETIERVAHPSQPGPVVRVRGEDLLTELAGRSVGDLRICELGWTYLDGGKGSVRRVPNAFAPGETDLPEAYDGDTGTETAAVEMRDNWWLYVGHDARFEQLRFTFGTTNDSYTTTLQVQYFNGEDWTEPDDVTDNTVVSGRPFAQNETITFTRPTDWERSTPTEASGSWFWVRIRRTPEVGDNFTVTLKEIEAYGDVPTQGGVDQIMAYAPDTWVRSGYADTATERYLEFHGESVLTALQMLTEQGGQVDDAPIREHFRLIHSSDAGYPAGGRAIVWLGTSTPASGILAMRVQDGIAFEGNATACAIRQITERLDTSDAISRIIPRSLDGITLAATTRAAPTGYTLDTAANYIRRDQAETDLGRIEEARQFTEVASQQGDSPEVHAQYAANALFDRALEYLRTHSQVNRYYDLVTARVPGAVLPGETLDVVYHDYADGYHSMDIDTVAGGAPLHVLGTVIAIDEGGVHTVAFEAGTIDREAASDAGVLAQTIQEVRRLRGAQGRTSVTLTGSVTDGGPLAGVDVIVEGRTVSRAGNRILLFHGDGSAVEAFDADAAGLDAAIAAAVSGDVILLPAGEIDGDHTVPAGVEVVGRGRENTVLSGQVTLGDGAVLRDLSVVRAADQAGALVGIAEGAGDIVARAFNVSVSVSNDTGPAYAVYMAHGGALYIHDSELLAEIGGDGYAAYVADGDFYQMGGRAVGTTPLQPYYA